MSIDQKQKELVESFSFFDNWKDRYSYLIEMGKNLPKFPESEKNSFNLINGCQSRVWFSSSFAIADQKMIFRAHSDSLLVSGILAMLVEVYSGSSPLEITQSNTNFITEIGLSEHLSFNRQNGLSIIIKYLYSLSTNYLIKQ